MANLTKEQRVQKEAEEKAKLEAKIRAEVEAEIRAKYEKENSTTETAPKKTKSVSKITKIPLDIEVPVICNVIGGATYIARNGDTVDWDEFGACEYMTLGEIVSMKNSQRRFFTDNWIILEDTEEYSAIELYEFLKVTKYYEHILTPDTIDSIFDMDDSTLIRTLSNLSAGMKATVAARAKVKIDAKECTGKTIDALETALNVKFSID
jgi:hypothetical protein